MDAKPGIFTVKGSILDFSVVELKDALLKMGIKMVFLHYVGWGLIRLGLPANDMIPAISIVNWGNP